MGLLSNRDRAPTIWERQNRGPPNRGCACSPIFTRKAFNSFRSTRHALIFGHLYGFNVEFAIIPKRAADRKNQSVAAHVRAVRRQAGATRIRIRPVPEAHIQAQGGYYPLA